MQGRTYAYIFGLVERFISAKVLDISREHWLGDQVALEALVRMTDEEIKHQEMFRRLEARWRRTCPPATCRPPTPNAVAQRRARQEHLGRAGADAGHRAVHAGALPRQHRAAGQPVRAVEGRVPVPLEGRVAARHPRRAGVVARGRAGSTRRSATPRVDDLIALVGAVDGILQAQAAGRRRLLHAGAPARRSPTRSAQQIHDKVLKAYRWQYIVSGVMEPRFQKVLFGLHRRAAGDAHEERAGTADLRRAGAAGSAVAAGGLTAWSAPRLSHAIPSQSFTGENHVLRHAFPAACEAALSPARRLAAILHAAFRAMLNRAAGAWRHAAARREFQRLDDNALRDLGISRSEFDSYWAESHGLAEQSRRRVMRDFHGSGS